MEKLLLVDGGPIERGGQYDIEIKKANGGMKKSVLSRLPNFIACMPCCLRRKTRVNTIPSMRTSISAPKYFAIRILRDFVYLAFARVTDRFGLSWLWRTPDLASQSASGKTSPRSGNNGAKSDGL